MHRLLIITLLLFTGCSKNKNLASDSFQNGLDAFEKKEYEKAISFFNDATELNPNEPKYITEIVRLYAVLISNIIQDDNDQNLDFILENFIQKVKFPLIQTDTHHDPQMWKNLPEDIKTERDRVKYMAFMDKLNEPIPLTFHDKKGGEITFGYLHYGDKKTINKTIRENNIIEPLITLIESLIPSIGPSLCDCINKPGNAKLGYDNNVAHCDKLMEKEFKTKWPSLSQMRIYNKKHCPDAKTNNYKKAKPHKRPRNTRNKK